MGPGYFVIAILGCADGGASCTPVATLSQRYENAAQCEAATAPALMENSEFDFPTLMAECRAGSAKTSDRGDQRKPVVIPASARRG